MLLLVKAVKNHGCLFEPRHQKNQTTEAATALAQRRRPPKTLSLSPQCGQWGHYPDGPATLLLPCSYCFLLLYYSASGVRTRTGIFFLFLFLFSSPSPSPSCCYCCSILLLMSALFFVQIGPPRASLRTSGRIWPSAPNDARNGGNRARPHHPTSAAMGVTPTVSGFP